MKPLDIKHIERIRRERSERSKRLSQLKREQMGEEAYLKFLREMAIKGGAARAKMSQSKKQATVSTIQE